MPDDNTTNMQQTQQSQKQEELRQHIQKMESASVKAYSENTLERDRMLSSVLEQKTRAIDVLQGLGDYKLRQYHIDVMNDEILGTDKQQKAVLDKNIARLNEESQKKRDREKAATSRLGDGHSYFEQSSADLTAARTRMLTNAKEGRFQANTDDLTGDEFAVNPENGAMMLSIDELLGRRMQLHQTVINAKSASLTGDDLIRANYHEELLKKMDEAIGLWYQANGVDFKTGKSVGNLRRKSARQEFALAMESYRDTRKNETQLLLQAKLRQLKETPEYKAQMRSFAQKPELVPDMQNSLQEVRELLLKHSDKYQQSQEIIDKIYQEWLQKMAAFTRKTDECAVLSGLLQQSSTLGDRIYSEYVAQVEIEQRTERLQLDMFPKVIAFFLDDRKEIPFSAHIFLHDHYGITTNLYRQAGEDLLQIESMKQSGLTAEQINEIRYRTYELNLSDKMRHEGKSALKIQDILFSEKQKRNSMRAEEALIAEVAARSQVIRESGGNPETDPDILQKKQELALLSGRLFAPDGNAMNLFKRKRIMDSAQNCSTYLERQRLFHNILHDVTNHKYQYQSKAKDGTVQWDNRYPEKLHTRDVAYSITPLESMGNCTDDMIMRSLDNIAILEKGEQSLTAQEEYALAEAEIEDMIQNHQIEEKDREAKLAERKEDRYVDRYQAALEEEIELMRSSKQEIENYIQEKNLTGRAVGILSMENLSRLTYDAVPIFEKTQGLGYRAHFVTKSKSFPRLPQKIRDEFFEFMEYYYAVNDWTRQFLKQYQSRADINEADDALSYILEPLDYYKGARREMFAPRREKTARAVKALERESELKAVQEETRRLNAELDAELIENRLFLITQDKTLLGLEAIAQETDQEKANKMAFDFLKETAERLIEHQPKIKERYDEMISHNFMRFIDPVRVLIAEKISDPERATELLARSSYYARQFRDLFRHELICSTVARELPFILKQEFKTLPLLETVANTFQDHMDNLLSTRYEELEGFQYDIARILEIQPQTENATPELFGEGSPYASYQTNCDEITDTFQRRVERMMEQVSHYTPISREDAEMLVLTEILEEKEAERRQMELERRRLEEQTEEERRQAEEQAEAERRRAEEQAEAERRRAEEQAEAERRQAEEHAEEERRQKQQRIFELSHEGNVVPQANAEVWKKYGGASFHMRVPAEEATGIIHSANGFLYAKEVENGVVELCPTLPEMISATVMGQEMNLPLRHHYNLFTKAITALLIDQNGGAISYSDEEEEEIFIETADNSNTAYWKSLVMRGMINLGNSKELAERAAEEIVATLSAVSDQDGYFIAMQPENQRQLSHIRYALAAAGNDPNALETHKERMESAMRAEGRPESEILESKNALTLFYNDVTLAREALLDIRNMDENTKDVALPNACSANGLMIQQFNMLQGRKDQTFLKYETTYHIKDHALEHINHILTHKDMLGRNLPAEEEQKLLDMKSRLEADPSAVLSDSDQRVIAAYSIAPEKMSKYQYHVAGNIGTTPDGRQITLECFAAETKQAIVPLFLRHAAVGLYRNGQMGMNGYYNMDNPLPKEGETMLVKLKEDFILSQLPGDPNYRSTNS